MALSFQDKIKPVGLSFQDKIQPVQQAGPFKYDVESSFKERLSNAQRGADEAQREADKANSFGGFMKNFGSAALEMGTIGTKNLGDTLGGIFSTNAVADTYSKASKTNTDTLLTLQNMIKKREAEGKDASNLKKQYNSIVDAIERDKKDFAQISAPTQKSNLQVGGELAGTALDALSFGTYGKAASGMNSFLLQKARPSILPSGGQGFFSRETAREVGLGASLGYGADVSMGLQGQRGESREGAGSFTPGLGTAIGIGAPAALRGAQSTSNAVRGVAETTLGGPSKRVNQDIARDFVDNIFTTTKSNKKRYEQIASRGINPEKELTKRGLVPDVVDGKADFSKPKTAITDELDDLNEVLDTSLQRYKDLKVRPDEVWSEIEKSIASDSFIRNAGKTKDVTARARNIFDNYVNDFNGDFNLVDIQDFKKAQYKESSKYKVGATPDYSKADDHALIARAFKKIIETKADDVSVKALNSEIGKLIEMSNFLQKVDGTAVRGGRLGLYAGRAIGSLIGAQGGFLGSLVGAIGGDFTARLLQRNAIIGPLKRYYLSRQGKGFVNPVLDDAVKYLNDIEKGLNPEVPEAVRKQIIQDLESNPKLLEAPKENTPKTQVGSGGVIPVAPKGAQMENTLGSIYRSPNTPSRMAQETINPNTAVNKNPIDATVPQFTKNATQAVDNKIKPPKEAFGAVAGFELDEEGNLTYNPAKGVLGAVGVAGVTRSQAVKNLSRSLDTATLRELRRFTDVVQNKLVTTDKKGFLKYKGSEKLDLSEKEVKDAVEGGLRFLNEKVDNGKLNDSTFGKIVKFYDEILGNTRKRTEFRDLVGAPKINEKSVAKKANETSKDLVQEARKYKSAEEFVDKSGIPVFRGQDHPDFTAFDGNQDKQRFLPGMKGTSFAKTKDSAQNYGDVIIEGFVPKSRLLEPSSLEQETLSALKKRIKALTADDYIEGDLFEDIVSELVDIAEVQNKGAIDLEKFFPPSKIDAEIRVVNPDAFVTKSQLIDIFNQAKQAGGVDKYAKLRSQLRDNEILVQDRKGNIGAILPEDFDATIYEKI